MEETKETQESLQRKREQALQRLRKERTEEALWDCVTAYQDFEFHTYSGLPYSYHMKYGRSGTYTKELWINRREKSKSLVWSSVRSAYQKVLELQPESEILVFDADEPDMEVFGKLPEWVQDIIRKSTQFADNAPEEKVDIPPEEPETPPDSKGACPI